MNRQARIAELVSSPRGCRKMWKVIAVSAVVAGVLVYYIACAQVDDALRRERRLAELIAGEWLASQEPPPPAECDDDPVCLCDLCTGEKTFSELVEEKYFEMLWETEIRDVRELDLYHPEDWEVPAS